MKRVKTIQIGVSISPIHEKMLDALLEKTGCLNYSEAIRNAIVSLHDSYFPAYKTLTPAGKLKERQITEEEVKEAMTDLEYNEKVLHGAIRKNKSGTEMVLIHAMGNRLQVVPLLGLKIWAETHPLDVDHHLNQLLDLSLDKMLVRSLERKVLLERHDILIE